MKMTHGWLLVIALASITTSAVARDRENSGAYTGVTVARTMFREDVSMLNRSTLVINPGETTIDTLSTGFSVYGGFRFNKHFAVDGGYIQFGELRYHIGARPAYDCRASCSATLSNPQDVTVHSYGLRVLTRETLPITHRWSVDAHLGIAVIRYTTNDEQVRTNASDSLDFGALQYSLYALYGVGTSFGLTRNVWTRLDWSHGRDNSEPPDGQGSFDSIALSLEYRFH